MRARALNFVLNIAPKTTHSGIKECQLLLCRSFRSWLFLFDFVSAGCSVVIGVEVAAPSYIYLHLAIKNKI